MNISEEGIHGEMRIKTGATVYFSIYFNTLVVPLSYCLSVHTVFYFKTKLYIYLYKYLYVYIPFYLCILKLILYEVIFVMHFTRSKILFF